MLVVHSLLEVMDTHCSVFVLSRTGMGIRHYSSLFRLSERSEETNLVVLDVYTTFSGLVLMKMGGVFIVGVVKGGA